MNKKTPLKTRAAQLIKVKIKPVVMEADKATSLSSFPVMLPIAVKPAARPMRILNVGPAQPASLLWEK